LTLKAESLVEDTKIGEESLDGVTEAIIAAMKSGIGKFDSKGFGSST
jgi:hypothetical protein